MALSNAAKDIVIKIRADDAQYQAALKKADASTATFSSSVAAYGKSMQIALASAAVAATGYSISAAADYESLERAFKRLVAEQGKDADEYIAKLKDVTKGTASQASLIEQANRAMLLGLDIDTLTTMAEGATVLAQATGQSSSYLFESMALGVGRQSRLLLDNLGIIVDTEQAYEDYAKALGKTTAELTEQEKKAAFLEAAMTGLNERVDSLGGFSEDTNTNISELKSNLSDLSTNLGEFFLPAVNQAVSGLSDIVADLNELVEWMNEASQTDIHAFVDTTATNSTIDNSINEWIRVMNEKKNEADDVTRENTEAVKENTAALTQSVVDQFKESRAYRDGIVVESGTKYNIQTGETTSYNANTSGAD